MEKKNECTELVTFLQKIPAVENSIGYGVDENRWWVKFTISINHPLAWSTVQELGFVLNYLSVDERLATVFYPVSPPPYLNGGPSDYLSWIIENTQDDFTADLTKQWLESRLPAPVDDEAAWQENN
jgi:hypothetical protein